MHKIKNFVLYRLRENTIEILTDFYHLFFPKNCCGCGSYLSGNEKFLCSYCRLEIPVVDFDKTKGYHPLLDIFGDISIRNATSVLIFEKKGIVQNIIHQLKYRGQTKIGRYLGEWLGFKLLSLEKKWDIDGIIPVPLHRKRLQKRGYNQVEVFGRTLSRVLGVPYVDNYLYRNRATPSLALVGESIALREQIIEGAFSLHRFSELKNKHWLLIDDVITTGSTLKNCARALLREKSNTVSIASMSFAFY